jgi:hypothetical protein
VFKPQHHQKFKIKMKNKNIFNSRICELAKWFFWCGPDSADLRRAQWCTCGQQKSGRSRMNSSWLLVRWMAHHCFCSIPLFNVSHQEKLDSRSMERDCLLMVGATNHTLQEWIQEVNNRSHYWNWLTINIVCTHYYGIKIPQH